MVMLTPLLFLIAFIAASAGATFLIGSVIILLSSPRSRLARSTVHAVTLLITYALGLWFIWIAPFFRFSPGAPLITILFWIALAALSIGIVMGLVAAARFCRRFDAHSDGTPTI